MDMEDMLRAEVLVSMIGVSDNDKDHVDIMAADAQPQMVTWQELQEATNNDEVLVKLREEIERGMSDTRHEVPAELKEFHKYRHGLVVMDGVITYKRRLVSYHQIHHH